MNGVRSCMKFNQKHTLYKYVNTLPLLVMGNVYACLFNDNRLFWYVITLYELKSELWISIEFSVILIYMLKIGKFV